MGKLELVDVLALPVVLNGEEMTLGEAVGRMRAAVQPSQAEVRIANLEDELSASQSRCAHLRERLATEQASSRYKEQAIHQIPDLGEDEDYQVAVRRVIRERDAALAEVQRLTGRTVEAFVLARLKTEMIDQSLPPDLHTHALEVIAELRRNRRDLGGGSNAIDRRTP